MFSFSSQDGSAIDFQNPNASCPEIATRYDKLSPDVHRNYIRMQSRQTYAYGVAFHLTGNQKYLSLAKAGCKYISKWIDENGSAPTWVDVISGEVGLAEGLRTTQVCHLHQPISVSVFHLFRHM